MWSILGGEWSSSVPAVGLGHRFQYEGTFGGITRYGPPFMESTMEIIMTFNRSSVGGLFSVMCYNTPRLADCLLRLACFEK